MLETMSQPQAKKSKRFLLLRFGSKNPGAVLDALHMVWYGQANAAAHACVSAIKLDLQSECSTLFVLEEMTY